MLYRRTSEHITVVKGGDCGRKTFATGAIVALIFAGIPNKATADGGGIFSPACASMPSSSISTQYEGPGGIGITAYNRSPKTIRIILGNAEKSKRGIYFGTSGAANLKPGEKISGLRGSYWYAIIADGESVSAFGSGGTKPCDRPFFEKQVDVQVRKCAEFGLSPEECSEAWRFKQRKVGVFAT